MQIIREYPPPLNFPGFLDRRLPPPPKEGILAGPPPGTHSWQYLCLKACDYSKFNAIFAILKNYFA
jgi:hypothetical protein